MKKSCGLCNVFFETLGTELKINLLDALIGKPKTVNALATELGEERSKISHALATLLRCGFVSVKDNGKQRIYSLNKQTIVPIMRLVEKHMKKYCRKCRIR